MKYADKQLFIILKLGSNFYWDDIIVLWKSEI